MTVLQDTVHSLLPDAVAAPNGPPLLGFVALGRDGTVLAEDYAGQRAIGSDEDVQRARNGAPPPLTRGR